MHRNVIERKPSDMSQIESIRRIAVARARMIGAEWSAVLAEADVVQETIATNIVDTATYRVEVRQ